MRGLFSKDWLYEIIDDVSIEEEEQPESNEGSVENAGMVSDMLHIWNVVVACRMFRCTSESVGPEASRVESERDKNVTEGARTTAKRRRGSEGGQGTQRS